METKITLFSELGNGKVYIRDERHVDDVIKNFIRGGVDKLQVISDFDMTLTRFTDEDGNPCHSCYHAIDSSEFVPQRYKDRANSLKDHYYPIEINPEMTIAEKTPYMIEWWNKAHDFLTECKLRKEWIPKMVSDSKVYFREGCDWLFERLQKLEVPLLVFSAGIGDIIEETFRSRSKLYDNIKIVSNFMHFDEQGVMDGFHGDLLHVFNKNENIVHRSDYFDRICHRHNILLMGDSLGDLRMAEGAACENVLRIGFLNDKIEENLEKYVNSFDVVLVDDQTMSVPNEILRKICDSSKIETLSA